MSQTFHSMLISTPLGVSLAVETNGTSLTRAEFQRARPASATTTAGAKAHPLLREAAVQVRAYFARRLATFDVPMSFEGTPFQCQVWRAVAALSFGHFVSYADVGRALGHPRSHRGVAAAMGKTPIDLFVPAHRVVGSDGKLKGCSPRSIRARLAAFERSRGRSSR